MRSPYGGLATTRPRVAGRAGHLGERALLHVNPIGEPGARGVLDGHANGVRVGIGTQNAAAHGPRRAPFARLAEQPLPERGVVAVPAPEAEVLAIHRRRRIGGDGGALDEKRARSAHGVQQHPARFADGRPPRAQEHGGGDVFLQRSAGRLRRDSRAGAGSPRKSPRTPGPPRPSTCRCSARRAGPDRCWAVRPSPRAGCRTPRPSAVAIRRWCGGSRDCRRCSRRRGSRRRRCARASRSASSPRRVARSCRPRRSPRSAAPGSPRATTGRRDSRPRACPGISRRGCARECRWRRTAPVPRPARTPRPPARSRSNSGRCRRSMNRRSRSFGAQIHPRRVRMLREMAHQDAVNVDVEVPDGRARSAAPRAHPASGPCRGTPSRRARGTPSRPP